MTTILVVDDQSMIRVGIRAILESQDDFDVVGEAADGRTAVKQNLALRPDLILMDVRMPVMDGLEATRQILSNKQTLDHQPRVLMLTTFDLDDYIYDALRAGASGFLLKDSDPEELLAAVRVVLAGESVLAPEVTRRLIERFVATQPQLAPTLNPSLKMLTEREREVLHLIALGLSNQEIADRLFIAEQTVKTHVSRILAKLGLRDRVQAVVFSYEAGIVTPGDRA